VYLEGAGWATGGPSTCPRGRGSPWASTRSGTSSSSSPCSRTRPQWSMHRPV